MKYLWILLFPAFVNIACGNNSNEDAEAKELPDEKLSLEELARRKVMISLDILGTENFNMKIEKAHLNTDDFEDAIILVNRKENALKIAQEKGIVKSQEETNYFGNHNYIFYYDGMTHKVTRPIGVPSSALVPLEISFLNIQSEGFKDFTIDVRLNEARYRNFYTVRNGAPALVFQWPIHNINDAGDFEINHIEYDKGSYSLAKDILIYSGESIDQLPSNLNTNFKLKTKKVGELKYRFFYNPKERKYFTNK